jgi:hypothetical protein
MILSRRFLALLAAGLSLLTAGLAAPDASADLGQGLAYLRVHVFASEAKAVDAALAANGALVLDLRYTTAQAADAALLTQALAEHRGSDLLCVLVSPATPPVLASALTAAPVRLITLGVAGSVPAPVVVVEQKAATDRQAYDAYESGTAFAVLLSGKIEKDRYDEAALMNDFSNGNTTGEPPEPDAKTLKDTPGKAPALLDRVLQRAVNLHRALAAIKPRS